MKQDIKDAIILMTFLGYEYVTIGYYGTEDETEFQRINEEWLEEMGIESIGEYFASVSQNEIYDAEDIDFTKDWNWLMKVIKKLQEIDKNIIIIPNIETMFLVCVNRINRL